jgi:hypothetical protein
MSGHGHHDAEAAHDEHDDHHEPETSSDDFPADEPRSPGWLPLLGGALLLAGIFALVVFGGDDKPAEDAAPPAAAAVVPPTPSPAQRPTMRLPPSMQLPAGRAPAPAHP